MDAPTLTALQQSIERWEMLSLASEPGWIRLGSSQCPLCVRFMEDGSGPECHRCPVFHRTAEANCGGTPYPLAADAFSSWRGARYYGLGYDEPACRDKFQAAARDEAEFLRSLLPPDVGG